MRHYLIGGVLFCAKVTAVAESISPLCFKKYVPAALEHLHIKSARPRRHLRRLLRNRWSEAMERGNSALHRTPIAIAHHTHTHTHRHRG